MAQVGAHAKSQRFVQLSDRMLRRALHATLHVSLLQLAKCLSQPVSAEADINTHVLAHAARPLTVLELPPQLVQSSEAHTTEHDATAQVSRGSADLERSDAADQAPPSCPAAAELGTSKQGEIDLAVAEEVRRFNELAAALNSQGEAVAATAPAATVLCASFAFGGPEVAVRPAFEDPMLALQ